MMMAAPGDNKAEVPVLGQEGETFEEKWARMAVSEELNPEQRQELKSLLAEFDQVFNDLPGEAKVTPFRVETGDSKHISQYPRRLPEKWKTKIHDQIKTLQASGIITPSTSPWASPIVPVPKPNGDVRCALIIGNLMPSPSPMYVDQLLEDVSRAQYITTLDLAQGYYQFPVAEEHQCKTAFVTPTGKWEFRRMPFGLKGAPTAFQREMDSLFQDKTEQSAFIDDLAVHSQSWTQHLNDVRTALKLLKDRGLTAKIAKCKFAWRSVEFLGHVVGGGMLGVQEAKIKAILDIPVSATKKKLMSFLGSTGYYRRFIPNYSTVAAKLSDLTKKALPDKFTWLPVHQEAFDKLKKALSEAPVLTAPDIRICLFL